MFDFLYNAASCVFLFINKWHIILFFWKNLYSYIECYEIKQTKTPLDSLSTPQSHTPPTSPSKQVVHPVSWLVLIFYEAILKTTIKQRKKQTNNFRNMQIRKNNKQTKKETKYPNLHPCLCCRLCICIPESDWLLCFMTK